MQAILTEGIEPIHYFLAYMGMLLHFMMKLAEVFNLPDFSIKTFMKKNIMPILISAIGIPILLIVATDSSIKETLPINKVTAVLAGWQTQSVFKTLFAFAGKKAKMKQASNTDDTSSTDTTDSNKNENPDVG